MLIDLASPKRHTPDLEQTVGWPLGTLHKISAVLGCWAVQWLQDIGIWIETSDTLHIWKIISTYLYILTKSMLFGKALATFQSLRFRKMHKYVRCGVRVFHGISYRMMLQTFSASNGMTPWHKSPTLGCVNSVSSRCSHVPEEHSRNHWDEEHENYTWVAMKYFLGKILKCIQFKV